MRPSITLFFLFMLMSSCTSNSTDIMDQMSAENNSNSNNGNSKEMYSGTFVADAHPTSGTCNVNVAEGKISLLNFKTDAGPILLLYLSTDVASTDFIDLGELKGIEGDFDYSIPDNTDFSKYNTVVIWCVDFSVSFGHAELM